MNQFQEAVEQAIADIETVASELHRALVEDVQRGLTEELEQWEREQPRRRPTSYPRCTRCNGSRFNPEFDCASDWHRQDNRLRNIPGYVPPL